MSQPHLYQLQSVLSLFHFLVYSITMMNNNKFLNISDFAPINPSIFCFFLSDTIWWTFSNTEVTWWQELPDRQKHNIRRQMEKIMKNETHTHLQISRNNADKWEQEPGCAVFIRSRRLSRSGTCLSCPIKFQRRAVLEASRQKPNYLQTG